MSKRRVTLRELQAMGVKLEITGGSSVREKPGTPERDFQDALMQYAKLRGWRRAHFRPARVVKNGQETWRTPVEGDGAGFPDLILLRGIRLVVIECKAGKNTTSEDQDNWLNAFGLAGAEVYVWYPRDFDRAKEILE